MDGFSGGMAILLDPYMLWVILAGTVLGVVVGALPGLSGSTTAALFLPLTISMGRSPASPFSARSTAPPISAARSPRS